jgi:eukaryotic-like serine/threonine-protein kinase
VTARYEVEDVIGRGAMGVVYRARQVGTGRRVVAYKRVPGGDPELLGRLRDEAETLAELDHPNIIRIFDVVPDSDGMAIVMQYAAGGTLAQAIAARGRIPADATVAVLATIADALASAHRQGVLHRDIKPANILFTADGNPLLSDFGVARRTTGTPRTDAGALGPATCEYLDPAVADGAVFDERSDCYALGVVAYEMLTGRRPFTGDTALAVLRAADRGEPTPLTQLAPDAPPALAEVVGAAMARDPRQRPAGAAQLAALLRAAVSGPEQGGGLDPRIADAHAAPAPAAPHDPPTRIFGPRPPLRPAPTKERATDWRRIGAVAALLLVVPPAIAALTLRGRGAADAEPVPVSAAVGPVLVTEDPLPVCDGVRIPAATGTGTVLTGDLHGDGCVSWVRYDDGVLEVAGEADEPLRFRVGEPGDQLVLGDWDCNGSQTAALYRPASGEVFHFSTWAGADAPLTSAPGEHSGVVGGTARVTVHGDCERVTITPPSNSAI